MPPAQLLHPHGELTPNDVMADYLDDNLRRLKRDLFNLHPDILHWQPDAQANSIAITLWHMGRIFDVFLTQQILGMHSDQECWIAGGWAAKTGYDPRGLGRDGWGSVNEYTIEEVTAMPKFGLELLLGYLTEVYNTVRDYILSTPMVRLTEAAPGFDGKFTRYQVISMALLDNVRHLGEILLILTLWKRMNSNL